MLKPEAATTRARSSGAPTSAAIAPAVAVDPVGAVDQFDRSGTDLVLKGWAVDGDTTGALDLHVYQDGAFTGSARADTSLTIRWTDNADGEDNYRFT